MAASCLLTVHSIASHSCTVMLFYLCFTLQVDAALDAANTQRVAELIPQVFAGAQALCVSHHSVTQMQAAHRITVAMQNGASTVVA
jgi:ABC-type iron transport system FetAB ATPase subunit